MASFDIENLINNFSDLSITNNNFDDEINEFMNIDINQPEKYRYPNAIIYGFKLNGDDENNFFILEVQLIHMEDLKNINLIQIIKIVNYMIILELLDG